MQTATCTQSRAAPPNRPPWTRQAAAGSLATCWHYYIVMIVPFQCEPIFSLRTLAHPSSGQLGREPVHRRRLLSRPYRRLARAPWCRVRADLLRNAARSPQVLDSLGSFVIQRDFFAFAHWAALAQALFALATVSGPPGRRGGRRRKMVTGERVNVGPRPGEPVQPLLSGREKPPAFPGMSRSEFVPYGHPLAGGAVCSLARSLEGAVLFE